jgi:signal transduction histidine kinase
MRIEPMLTVADSVAIDRQTAVAADALFATYQQQIYRRTDRLFACLMAGQWVAGIVFALVVAPRTWAGTASTTYGHVWAAVLLGGIISLFPAVLALLRPGQPVTRYTIAAAQMLMGALLIHLTGGRIETHFHLFGSLAFLAFYRDWRVLVPATVVVALDHFLRGLFWPESVYGVVVASHWRWLEHVAWVVFEDVFLVMACVRGTQELRKIADRTAVMEEAHREHAAHALEKDELIARLRLSQQEVEAATRAKSEFLANMSHELRTPLNAITLYSELLQECAAEEGRHADVADLTNINTAGRHLLSLIDGILDLSKIEAGKMELDLEPLDVRQMVHDLVSTIDPIVRKQDNTLTVTIAGDVGMMQTDALKTRQILFNLLSNAAKFTRGGRIELTVSRGEFGGVPCVEFVVTDTGIGITHDQQRRLFRPFVQADMSIARKYGGTGLGLALVWRFCRLMGGDVRVDSQIDEGARFSVRLPVEVVTPAEHAA